jgi:uncharacterized membrane protein YccC
VRPADAAWAFALRAGLAVFVPLGVLVALGRTSSAPFATFGAFAALYGRDSLYRRRAVLVAASGAGLVASVFVGGLAALAAAPVGVIVVAAVGGAATLWCSRYQVGPPGGLMFTFATAVCSALPTRPGDLPSHAGLAAGSALAAWLIVMSGALLTPDAPRRLAVARALRAAAALHEAPHGPAGLKARHQAALAIERAWRAIGPDRTERGDPRLEVLVAHAETPRLEVLVAHAETELSGVHGHSAEVAAESRAQVIAELLVIRNYGLAMLAVTPLALLVGELGRKSPPLDLIGDRLVQTILGCVLGLAAAAVVSNRAATRHLTSAITAVEEATTVVPDARRLALLVATMREAYEVAAGEPGLAEETVDRMLHAEHRARAALVDAGQRRLSS